MSLSFLGCGTNGSKIITKEQYKSESKLNDNIVTREIDISKSKNLDLIMNINDVTKINGVYGYNNGAYGFSSKKENKTLILFNGIDGFYSDVNFSVKNRVLIINYKYNKVNGTNKRSLFMVDDSNKNRSYDKVELYNDGKPDTYVNILG
jgi:hypothetical protein